MKLTFPLRALPLLVLCASLTIGCGGNKAETTEGTEDATMADSTVTDETAMNDEMVDANTTADQSADSATGAKATVVTKEGDALRMRSQPDISSGIVGSIPNGSTLEIIGEDSKDATVDGQTGRWMKVRFNGAEGWAWSGFLQKQ
jgi:uncharacterized protein YraI